MSAEIRSWINADSQEVGLTAGELKKYLQHVPDAAVMADGSDALVTSLEAIWNIGDDR